MGQTESGKTAVLTGSPYTKELQENRTTLKEKTRIPKKRLTFTKNDSKNREDDAACIYCSSLFSDSKAKEKWVQCTKCKNWAHEDCSGFNKKMKNFICDICA